MHFIDPFLYHNALLFPIICRISYGRKITCVGVICIFHGHWIFPGAPSNSSFILEPKNQSKIANQVSWFRRIFWKWEIKLSLKSSNKNDFGLSKKLNSPNSVSTLWFQRDIIYSNKIFSIESSLFYWVSTAGNYIWFCKRHSNSDVRTVYTRDLRTVIRFGPWFPGIDGLEQ